MVIYEVRGGRDIERGCGGIGHAQLVSATHQLAVGLQQHAELGFQAGLDAFVVLAVDNSRQLVNVGGNAFMPGHRKDIRLQRTGETYAKRQGAFLVGLQADDDHIVG